jgi:hypothetical protein
MDGEHIDDPHFLSKKGIVWNDGVNACMSSIHLKALLVEKRHFIGLCLF